MSEKPKDIQAAEWLIVAFAKCWTMGALRVHIESIGLGTHYEFLPRNEWWYGQCPVRGFIEQNYPKLNSFLISAPVEKQIKAASQIIKLTPKVERPNGSLNVSERREIAKARKDIKVSTTSYNLSRAVFKPLTNSMGRV